MTQGSDIISCMLSSYLSILLKRLFFLPSDCLYTFVKHNVTTNNKGLFVDSQLYCINNCRYIVTSSYVLKTDMDSDYQWSQKRIMVCYFQRSCQNARATENLFGLYGPGIGLLCTLLSKWLKGGKISQVSQSSHLREARFHNLYMTVSKYSHESVTMDGEKDHVSFMAAVVIQGFFVCCCCFK